jgi:DNA-binding MltR family transcriptional regulator
MAFGEGAYGEYALGESDLTKRIAELAKADAGHVIMAVAITDQILETLILAYMPKMEDAAARILFEHRGPLDDLLAKAKFAKALGLIDADTYADLKGIQKVRNTFAHPKGFLHFKSPEVAEVFKAIKHWRKNDDLRAVFDSSLSRAAKAMDAKYNELIFKHASSK